MPEAGGFFRTITPPFRSKTVFFRKPSTMKQELRLKHEAFGSLVYRPAISGQIELAKLTDTLYVLRLFFQKLRITDKPAEMYYDWSTEVMLTNYPVSITSLDELDGKEFFIKDGFGEDALTTMLSIRDGEPVNNSRISFKKIKPGCFYVEWRGCWGEDNYDDVNFELYGVANEEVEIITPLCNSAEELIETFDKK